MTTPFKSITGIEVNNPDICIGEHTGFACICRLHTEKFARQAQEITDIIDELLSAN